MMEYVNVRASETLGQGELVRFLQTRFPLIATPVGRTIVEGTASIEVRVPANSPELHEIQTFIDTKRAEGVRGFCAFSIGWYLRKYSQSDLQKAQILRLKVTSHFEPAGEECGTIYETVCKFCNLGRQVSDLILDLRRVPQHCDICQTIAGVEWIVSSKFVQAFMEHGFTGAEFRPVFEFKNPNKRSRDWYQLWMTGRAGELAGNTQIGRDPFDSSDVEWQCPLKHSMVAALLSEIYLKENTWDGSDIAITDALFGQGRNLLRPSPLIIISQRLYRMLQMEGLKGFMYEVAHLAG